MSDDSVFYPRELRQRASANAERFAWAAQIRESVVQAAQPWVGISDEELWALMFGHTIRRSWMVWSSGHCPACKAGVPMYNWRIEALELPWKLRCPHCEELFPKNDFEAFYQSGLDDHGVFDSARADRTLLFNTDHPDESDPLHTFGVDGGEGYTDGENTWWFIGAYLIYGQWKQAVHGGIKYLSAAWVVTGDRSYAHKAILLLDRVADLYPSFNFKEEGVMYEGPADRGYVSTWHDACEETREMALAFDQVRSAVFGDEELVRFLQHKARDHGLPNPKASPEDICRNIEDGLLRHPLANSDRISTNYPRREIALIILKTVLDRDGYRAEVAEMIHDMLEQATAVDGVTGEKGLAGYSAGVIHSLAEFLERFTRIDDGFLADLLERHPNLRQTYRFHIDTWCLQQYYPQAGDTGSFARKYDRYVGAAFSRTPGLLPSIFSLFWRLYKLTGDPAYVQVLYLAADDQLDQLPHDLFAADPAEIQAGVREVIEEHGTEIDLGSANKPDWHIAVLRAGAGPQRRAAWIKYDSGGRHGHMDGMNLGLFAHGMDLMPDFGYPPVQFGGWSGPKFHWYLSTASHNTVVVDGKDQERPADGRHTLWGAGDRFRAIRVSGPDLYKIGQYERTVVMSDISDSSSYSVDIFRVFGGADHAKFMHSHFGTLTTTGLELQPSSEYGFGTQMRAFRTDRSPPVGWSAEWRVEDRFGYLGAGQEVLLRYQDLTSEADASTAEAWVSLGTATYEEAWIPRIMIRRQSSDGPLASTFVGVIESYEGSSAIESVRRLELSTDLGELYPDTCVAVEVALKDGRTDLIVAADVENPQSLEPSLARAGALLQVDWGLRLEGELCVVRRDPSGEVTSGVIWKGRHLSVGEAVLDLARPTEFIEVEFNGGESTIVSGEGSR